MHYKSQCLTNAPTRFGAHCQYLQGIPSSLSTLQNINWF